MPLKGTAIFTVPVRPMSLYACWLVVQGSPNNSALLHILPHHLQILVKHNNIRGFWPQLRLFYTMRGKKKSNEPITQEGWNCIIKNIHNGFTEQH